MNKPAKDKKTRRASQSLFAYIFHKILERLHVLFLLEETVYICVLGTLRSSVLQQLLLEIDKQQALGKTVTIELWKEEIYALHDKRDLLEAQMQVATPVKKQKLSKDAERIDTCLSLIDRAFQQTSHVHFL